MSVIENVTKQGCAIDHFISKYSLLLINQFILREIFVIKENIPRMRLLCSRILCTHGSLLCSTYNFQISSTCR